MRRPFTRQDCAKNGITLAQLRWKLHTGEWQQIERCVYLAGSEPPTPVEKALAVALALNGIVSHSLAGILYDFDSVYLSEPFASVPKRPKKQRRGLRIREVEATLVRGYRCTTGLQTLMDLAEVLSDLEWEHALENALRDELTTIDKLIHELPRLTTARARGTKRIRNVLALRPDNAPPTESLLETLMVQLIRTTPELPEPTRQFEVRNKYGDFVGRPDLCWPHLGVFIELDGMGFHKQPVYDASRQTAIVAATGWRPARFTWKEVRHVQRTTLRRLCEITSHST